MVGADSAHRYFLRLFSIYIPGLTSLTILTLGRNPMSDLATACGTDVQYTLTVNIQNHRAADILNNESSKIRVGYPEDDQGFDSMVIEGESPKFHCSRPVKVTFSARPVAAVDYFIGYAKEFSDRSQPLHLKNVNLGRVYRLDDSGIPKIEEASWVH